MSIDEEIFKQKLGDFLPFHSKIVLTKNSKIIISIKQSLFTTLIEINRVFLDAKMDIINEIIFFIKNFKKNNSKVKNAKDGIKKFFEQNIVHTKDNTKIKTDYKDKNIVMLFHEVISKLKVKFEHIDFTKIQITWGNYRQNQKRIIRFGSFTKEKNLVRLHPLLDDGKIPDYFVKSVIYHEVGHFIFSILHPDAKSQHNRSFYNLLKEIDENYQISEEWESKNKHIFFTSQTEQTSSLSNILKPSSLK